MGLIKDIKATKKALEEEAKDMTYEQLTEKTKDNIRMAKKFSPGLMCLNCRTKFGIKDKDMLNETRKYLLTEVCDTCKYYQYNKETGLVENKLKVKK
jgi:hypothetical protein